MALSNSLQEEIDVIKQRFLLKLKESLVFFHEFINCFEEEEIDHFKYQEALSRIHKIAGSAELFGCAKLGDMAVELENELTADFSRDKARSLKTDLNVFVQEAEIVIDRHLKPKNEDIANGVGVKHQFTILIVDDNSLIREVVSKALQEEGCTVYEAEDGEGALKVAKLLHHLDLILLDVNLPKKNGFEVVKGLKQEESLSEIPVIMLTRRVDDQDVAKGLSSGAVDYIAKPFRVEDMVRRVMGVLHDVREKKYM